jgi:hypothetical protein
VARVPFAAFVHQGFVEGSSMSRWIGLFTCLLLVTGCSDRPAIVPVSGKVMIDGQPLTYGTIMVIPDAARASFGKIGPDGSFSLTCYDENDGCVPGKHKVTVSAVEALNSSKQKWHAPKKYTEPDSSGLTVDISEPTDALVVNLTWDGGKPFIENAAGDQVGL